MGESNSIQNQRMMQEKYAADNGFENTLFISDDGYSGHKLHRPGWNELMRLAENDEVATIIVKDMSRLGRNYLLVDSTPRWYSPATAYASSVNNNVDSLIRRQRFYSVYESVQ
jgi:DNA invertase Pin-like site-specific DNA recombinase